MNPRYSPKGQLNGWQGTAELVIEGRDLTGIGQLAGRIQSMTIARVAQGLEVLGRDHPADHHHDVGAAKAGEFGLHGALDEDLCLREVEGRRQLVEAALGEGGHGHGEVARAQG